MKTSTTTAIAALLVAAIGLTSFASTASAAPVTPAGQNEPGRYDNNMGPGRFDRPMIGRDGRDNNRHLQMMRADRPGRAGGLLNLVCAPDGAERLEIGLVRLEYRLKDLTAEQKALFDTFKAKALTTQTSLSDSCKAALQDRTAGAKPDLVERLKAGIAVETARLTAMNAVLPDFEAFYSSLTDTQKAALMPHGGMHGPDGNGPGGDAGPDDNGA